MSAKIIVTKSDVALYSHTRIGIRQVGATRAIHDELPVGFAIGLQSLQRLAQRQMILTLPLTWTWTFEHTLLEELEGLSINPSNSESAQ